MPRTFRKVHGGRLLNPSELCDHEPERGIYPASESACPRAPEQFECLRECQTEAT